MKKRETYNNPLFRIASPLLFGAVIYVLVLLFFGSVDMLSENFFSREILFVIILTTFFLESQRLVIVILNRTNAFGNSLQTRILLQFGISLSESEFCWSRQCVQQIEKHSRDVLKIDWKPIVVFPEEAKRFRN